jgi:hypothetical protein
LTLCYYVYSRKDVLGNDMPPSLSFSHLSRKLLELSRHGLFCAFST